MDDGIIIHSAQSSNEINVVEVAKRSKHRSSRARKIAAPQSSENIVHVEMKSDSLGPFWFEESHNVIVNGKSIHKGISTREKQQLHEIVKSGFYSEDVLRNLVIKLNNETSNAPRLRAYDWAVTNYAKGNPMVMLVKNKDGTNAMVDPNLAYEGELRKHHRLLFDPFRRGTHIFFDIDTNIHRSTVGQLTFIKWCIDNGVDKYVESNLKMIRSHMSKATKRSKEVSLKEGKKRRELTKAPTKLIRGFMMASYDILTDGKK